MDIQSDDEIIELIKIYNLIRPNFYNLYKSNLIIQQVLLNNSLVTKFINYGYAIEDAQSLVLSFMLYITKELTGLNR